MKWLTFCLKYNNNKDIKNNGGKKNEIRKICCDGPWSLDLCERTLSDKNSYPKRRSIIDDALKQLKKYETLYKKRLERVYNKVWDFELQDGKTPIGYPLYCIAVEKLSQKW